MSSTRLHQSCSSHTLDQLDPTTLAISLIPLLPTQQETNLTLPILAASLSTLPHNVVNAIHFLAQELKGLKEHKLLNDNQNDDRDRETREKWLNSQKVTHLKKSITSLTDLQTSLQSRLLTTVDTLSDLQQKHKRDTQQLADERDGVRAVNQVLKRKITTLEKQLQESKDIMESVLERVQVVNKGDWSIVEHGVIQVLSPLPTPSFPDPVNAQENSFLSEGLCSLHQRCRGDSSSPVPRPDTIAAQFLSSSTTTSRRDEGLNRSTTSDTHQRTNQRSLALIVELTEELENLRQEVKLELRSKLDEINRLKGLILFRDDELRLLMHRLEHFMGLDGFYLRDSNAHHLPVDSEYPEEFFNQSTIDVESTPRQNLDARRKNGGGMKNGSEGMRRDESPSSETSEQRRLEEEIKQLENHLKEVTQSQNRGQFPPSPFAFVGRTSTTTKSVAPENDRSSLVSVNASDDHAISRVLADLSDQVVDLKHKLKEVSRERDALQRLRSRTHLHKKGSNSTSQTEASESEVEEQETPRGGIKEALDRSRVECERLTRLLGQSERRIVELEQELSQQEAEFERVAERVQEKLKDQRSKMSIAQSRIDQLVLQLDSARIVESDLRNQLDHLKIQLDNCLKSLDRTKKKSRILHHHPDSLPASKDRHLLIPSDDALLHSSSSSSSASSSRSSKARNLSDKDPFN